MTAKPDEPTTISDPCLAFPKDMRVRAVRSTWSVNNTAKGESCLWIRTESSCTSMILTPEQADHLSITLRESAKRGRDIADEVAREEARKAAPRPRRKKRAAT